MTKFLENHIGLTVLLCGLVLVGGIFALNWAFQPTMDRIEWKEMTYRVQAGDSLWAIASEYCPDGVDRREWIDEVQALNGMDDSMIHPGQKLTVLMPVG